jgi:hypothetical protein
MAGDNELLANPERGSRLSRRVLLAGTAGAAGAPAGLERSLAAGRCRPRVSRSDLNRAPLTGAGAA